MAAAENTSPEMIAADFFPAPAVGVIGDHDFLAVFCIAPNIPKAPAQHKPGARR